MIEENGRFLKPSTRSSVGYSEDGMSIAGKILIRKSTNRHIPVEDEEVGDTHRISGAPLREQLAKIARHLDDGLIAEAIFLANLLGRTGNASSQNDGVGKANFNQNEPRSHGRWSIGSNDDTSPKIEDIQYRGRYHDFVLDDLLKGLAGSGSKVLKNVRVFGINGLVAIPDGASKPPNLPAYFIEMKTGFDPKFTKNQVDVYALICTGGHAVSIDPRISDLGLTPSVPLPPMKIMIVHTLGPGMPMSFHNYCEDFRE